MNEFLGNSVFVQILLEKRKSLGKSSFADGVLKGIQGRRETEFTS